MNIPPLHDISIQTIYSGIMGMSLIAYNEKDRDVWYDLLGDYKMNWYFKDNRNFVIEINTRLGTYTLASDKTIINHPAFEFLDELKVLTCSYRGNDGQLHHTEPILLNRLPR